MQRLFCIRTPKHIPTPTMDVADRKFVCVDERLGFDRNRLFTVSEFFEAFKEQFGEYPRIVETLPGWCSDEGLVLDPYIAPSRHCH